MAKKRTKGQTTIYKTHT